MGWIEAVYHFAGPWEEARARAQALAIEQSVEMPVEAVLDPFTLDHVVGRVVGLTRLGDQLQALRVALSMHTVGDDAGQLLNMLFGNSSLHSDLALVEIAPSPALLKAMGGGPGAGLEGLRRRTGAEGRALTASALKPQGLSPHRLADIAGALARAGVDYVKDDHGLADQAFSPFRERAPACGQATRRANEATGGRTRYVPSLSGNLDALREQLRILRGEGLDAAMIAPAIIGLSNVQALTRENPDIAFFAHPALAGAARIDPACLAALWRLVGVDAVIFPNHGGRFGHSTQTCRSIARACLSPDRGRAAAPVPAGGMSLARIPEMLDFYGDDVMLLIGGALLAEGERIEEAARQFVGAVRQPSAAGSHV